MENGTPFLFEFQVHEDFDVEKSGGVGAVVRTPNLAPTLPDLGKGTKKGPGLIHDADAFGGTGTGSEGAANPESALVKVREELGTDVSPRGEKSHNEKNQNDGAECDVAMLDGPF